ncbi:MAG: HigA family addiction module antitoxin [Polyangiaceae bacterium]|nr:HigA family addiction module antitoxin [Polyangiaceae bacterium]
MKHRMRPVHPGEILREEYLVPLGLSASKLAQQIGVPANRVSAIVAERRSVTADTALRLARAFRTTPEFWLNLQQRHDLRLAEDALDRTSVRIVTVKKGAAHTGARVNPARAR